MNFAGIKFELACFLMQNSLRRYGHVRQKEEDGIIIKILEKRINEKLLIK